MGEHHVGGGGRRRATLLATLLGVAGLAACGDSDLEVVSGPGPGEPPPAQAVAEDASYSPDPPATGTPDTLPSTTSSSSTSSSSTTAPGDTTTTLDPSSSTTEGNGGGAGGGGGARAPASPYAADQTAADRSLVFVNQKRGENGRGGLRADADLQTAAQEWARQMAVDQNMRHDPDRGAKMPDRYRSWGENVAYGHSPASIDQAWWDSEGHRNNILGRQYDAVGIAFVRDPDGTYWAVQIFGGD